MAQKKEYIVTLKAPAADTTARSKKKALEVNMIKGDQRESQLLEAGKAEIIGKTWRTLTGEESEAIYNRLIPQYSFSLPEPAREDEPSAGPEAPEAEKMPVEPQAGKVVEETPPYQEPKEPKMVVVYDIPGDLRMPSTKCVLYSEKVKAGETEAFGFGRTVAVESPEDKECQRRARERFQEIPRGEQLTCYWDNRSKETVYAAYWYYKESMRKETELSKARPGRKPAGETNSAGSLPSVQAEELSRKLDALKELQAKGGQDVQGLAQDLKEMQTAQSGIRAAQRGQQELLSWVQMDMEDLGDRVDEIAGKLDKICNPVETLLGAVNQVYALLTQDGVIIAREERPVNYDAARIDDAKNLIGKLTEELASVGHSYVREAEKFENASKKEESHNQELSKVYEEAKNAGKAEGEQALLRSLLGLYEDLDALQEREGVLAAFLKEHGLRQAGRLAKGGEVVLSAEEAEALLTEAEGLGGAGRYRVLRSLWYLGDQMVSTAQLEEIVSDGE